MHLKSFEDLKIVFFFCFGTLFLFHKHSFPVIPQTRDCHFFISAKKISPALCSIHHLLSSRPACRTGRGKIFSPIPMRCFCNNGIHSCQYQSAPACELAKGFATRVGVHQGPTF